MNESIRKVPCEKIRASLLEYLTRELGPEQERFVGEHLRTCAACRDEAARIERTIAALRKAPAAVPPAALRPTLRKRLERALLHPVIDWVCEHHRLVAWITALAVFAAVMTIAWHFRFKPDVVIYWTR